MKYFSKNTRGFTLIELLVVIAIIGVLGSIVFAAVGEARKMARDDARKSGLKAMELSLRLYFEVNGRYPESGGTCPSADVWCTPGDGWGNMSTGVGAMTAVSSSGNAASSYIEGLAPRYVGVLPIDPKNELDWGTGYLYATNSSGSEYKLMVYGIESKRVSSPNDEMSRCGTSCTGFQCSGDINFSRIYAIYSPGAACW